MAHVNKISDSKFILKYRCSQVYSMNKKKKPQIPYKYKGIWGLTKAGEEGLEPPFTVLETVALPLNYSPMDRRYISA